MGFSDQEAARLVKAIHGSTEFYENFISGLKTLTVSGIFKMRTAVLLVLIFGSAIAQEDGSILNVRQIMKDTFDIIRNAPPLPGFNEVSKIILSTTQVPPVRQYVPTNPPPQPIPLTYDQIQMLRQQFAQQRAVNAQQLSPQQEIQRMKQLEYQYQLMQMQQRQQQQPLQQRGQVVYGPQANYGQAARYGPVPQQVQQPQPVLGPLARIFATPTEKDVERLLRLPTEILYKMAKEGQYIEPERNQYYDSRSSEYDRSSSSSSGSSGFGSSDSGATPDAAGGLFGNGFSFNLQGNGDNMGMPVTPPTELQSTTPQPIQTTTVSASTVATILAMAENATLDNVPKFTFNESNISKPYFTYRTYENPKNDHWELIIPNTDGKPSIRVPMAEVLRLSKIVAKATHRAGMPVGAPTEVEGLGQINLDLFTPPVTSPATEAPVTTVATTQAAPVLPPKQEQSSPDSAFVQESESPRIQKPDESPSGPSGSSPLYAGQEIILNGKRYKLIDDDGNVNTGVLAAAAKAEELKQQAVATAPPSTLPPVPVRNQPALPALMSAQPQPQQVQEQQPVYPQLTPEQRSILMEMQQRIMRQELSRQQLEIQQAMAAIQPQTQPGAQAAPAFVMTEPPAALPTDPNQSYYGKVQIPSESSQQFIQQQTNNVQQPYQLPQQAVISEQQQHAMAVVKTPVQIVKPQPSAETASPVLPMKNQYSLAELEEFYKIHNANSQAETTTSAPIEVTTTSEPAHVYAPHKQIKIQVNNTQTSAPTEVSETQIVDATADAADQEKQRVADLRRQFAVERRHLNRLNKSKIERTTGLDATTPASPLITEQHCYNIRNFARQHGFQNTYEYAKTHCHFIENYYPDLKCDNVKDYMQICQQYYSTRRLLFTA
uniref:Kazal-like domain-containing protein n=1 Tax=Panagrellus redivivus TaxID=6233 RepID=A0A7E4VMC6_PANRE